MRYDVRLNVTHTCERVVSRVLTLTHLFRNTVL